MNIGSADIFNQIRAIGCQVFHSFCIRENAFSHFVFPVNYKTRLSFLARSSPSFVVSNSGLLVIRPLKLTSKKSFKICFSLRSIFFHLSKNGSAYVSISNTVRSKKAPLDLCGREEPKRIFSFICCIFSFSCKLPQPSSGSRLQRELRSTMQWGCCPRSAVYLHCSENSYYSGYPHCCPLPFSHSQ